jgi:RNA polymerase sigma-70 factor (ECF subfamily)
VRIAPLVLLDGLAAQADNVRARYPLGVMPAEGVGGVTVTRDDLVLRARSGDHDAFDVLARSVTARLYAIALRILRDVHLAEDSVQDSLVDGWRDLRALRDPALFDAWMTRILVRNCYRAAKRNRATRQLTVPTAEHTSDHSTAVAERDRLAQAFGRLTPEHRVVVVLRYYLEWEPTEIADALGVAPGTVRSRLHYGLENLRAVLEADARAGAPSRGGVP